MSAILEAYWLLAAKRFVDNVCMTLDKKIMGAVAHKMQGEGELPRGEASTARMRAIRSLVFFFSCPINNRAKQIKKIKKNEPELEYLINTVVSVSEVFFQRRVFLCRFLSSGTQ